MATTRVKTGGRQVGTPNRVTQDIADKLAAVGCDPLLGMAKLAADMNNSPDLRGRMLAELARYVAPQRKAVEVTGDNGGPVHLQHILSADSIAVLKALRGPRTS